jgi:mannitol 2-dehydrogenase
MAVKLNRSNLDKLSNDIKVPNYKKEELSHGILHFGVGNFHRSHQVVYLNSLFNKGLDHDWAIIGSGVLQSDEKMRVLLKEQDYLTTVVEQSSSNSSALITGAMIDYLSPNNPEEIIEKLSDPSIKIVSLTITEGGYFINSATGLFDNKHEAIVYDSLNPNNPKTVFGLILAGLKKRKELGIEAFTVMSCDNIPHNGKVTSDSLSGLAKLSDENFSSWIKENVAFPNGMVDRITPATTNREKELLVSDFDIEDNWPVFCEDFTQWVLEDNFPSGRPALEKVGVQFVEDVTPYEHMKIRILNGGHAVIAYLGGLLDIKFAHEAMENSLVLGFFKKIQENEIIPVLPSVPNTNLTEYGKTIESRFSNPKIADTIVRLCYDGSNRQPKFIIPSIADCLEKNIDISGLTLVCALWCKYCYGQTQSGLTIESNDPSWERLNKIAIEAKENPLAWIEMEDIYGAVGKNKVFQESFTLALNSLWFKGVEKTIQDYLDKK